jgi:hypothetical protein
MMPTADQVAAVIVAAARETGTDPMKVPVWEVEHDHLTSIPATRARTYAAIALRKLFPGCPMPVIGRMVGSTHPPYVSIVYTKVTKGHFRWFDQEALRRVIAAGAISLPAAPKTAQAAPAAPAASLPAKVSFLTAKRHPDDRQTAPSPPKIVPERTYQPGDFLLTPSKRRLLDELRAAVENTAKMPSQN